MAASIGRDRKSATPLAASGLSLVALLGACFLPSIEPSPGGAGASGGQGTGASTGAGGDGGGAGGAPLGPCDGPEDCPEDLDCVTHACTEGLCFATALPDGSMLQDPAGNCKRRVCKSGVAVEEADELDLPDDSNECTEDTCDGTTPVHTPISCYECCGQALDCVDGSCQGCDGDVGLCPPSQACFSFTCPVTQCIPSFEPAGTPCGPATCSGVPYAEATTWSCNTTGGCIDQQQSCGSYQCAPRGDACLATCTVSADCQPGNLCNTKGGANACEDCATCAEVLEGDAEDHCASTAMYLEPLRMCFCGSPQQDLGCDDCADNFCQATNPTPACVSCIEGATLCSVNYSACVTHTDPTP